MTILDIQGLTMRFGGLIAVNSFNLSVEEGKIYSIIGPNGAGKTTILNVLSRYYTPQEGKITFDGKDLLKMRSDQVLRNGIARSFQNVELLPKLSLRDNLMIGYDYRTQSGFLSNVFTMPKSRREKIESEERVDEVIELLGLERYVKDKVNDLPFGVQKRVDMGRALISRPKLILLDEPVAGTNTQETMELAEIIQKLSQELGLTVLMIEHDMTFVMNISDQVACMVFGKEIAVGNPEEIQNNPEVIEAYLGEKDDEFC